MRKDSSFLHILVSAASVVGIGYVTYNALPKDNMAQVIEVHWLTTTNLYEKVYKHHSGWNSTPRGAHNVKCYSKHRGKQYCFCKNDKYDGCQVCPAYDMFCEYDTYDWMLLESINTDGTDYHPIWPDVIVVGDDQKTESYIRFEVLFRTRNNEIEIYKPDNLYDFEKFIIGDVWKIKYNPVGSTKPIKLIKERI